MKPPAVAPPVLTLAPEMPAPKTTQRSERPTIKATPTIERSHKQHERPTIKAAPTIERSHKQHQAWLEVLAVLDKHLDTEKAKAVADILEDECLETQHGEKIPLGASGREIIARVLEAHPASKGREIAEIVPSREMRKVIFLEEKLFHIARDACPWSSFED